MCYQPRQSTICDFTVGWKVDGTKFKIPYEIIPPLPNVLKRIIFKGALFNGWIRL